jgi:hypothetical protein
MFVAAELIRPLEASSDSRSEVFDFQEGDKVEALYKGKGTKWFSGKVSFSKCQFARD